MSSFPYKAIFFDLDDTLCNYWDAAKIGLNQTFLWLESEYGIAHSTAMAAWIIEFRAFCPNLRTEGWYEPYLKIGETTRIELMRRTLSRLTIENNNLAKLLSDYYFEHRQKSLCLFPESKAVLDRLSSIADLGLITNGPSDIQNFQIDLLQIRKYFKTILIEGELGFGKPDVRVLEIAEQFSQGAGKELLFVGNNYLHDILPAISRGWDTYWVRRPSDVPPSADDDALPENRPIDSPTPTFESNSLIDLLNIG